jgi:hypothetical protein
MTKTDDSHIAKPNPDDKHIRKKTDDKYIYHKTNCHQISDDKHFATQTHQLLLYQQPKQTYRSSIAHAQERGPGAGQVDTCRNFRCDQKKNQEEKEENSRMKKNRKRREQQKRRITERGH